VWIVSIGDQNEFLIDFFEDCARRHGIVVWCINLKLRIEGLLRRNRRQNWHLPSNACFISSMSLTASHHCYWHSTVH